NTYIVELDLSSVEKQAQQLVEVYPNPTSGTVNISGVEAGNTIRVFNNVGQNVLNMKAGASKVTAPLHGQPAGIYMIIVNDGAQEVAKFKLIKK
ncbi:MAG: T9SS type A sorting domain-containing protein, partial [Prolixibacteraceae bacterium]|nr:T9SS type A sorting domain-containing protein [Prolixibacteraceae bacterium]